MFKNLGKFTATATQGLFGKVFKGRAYIYIDGTLVDQDFQIIEREISLTRAAKLVSGYPSINGRSWFKRITSDELTEEAFKKLTEMGLLNESHQTK